MQMPNATVAGGMLIGTIGLVLGFALEHVVFLRIRPRRRASEGLYRSVWVWRSYFVSHRARSFLKRRKARNGFAVVDRIRKSMLSPGGENRGDEIVCDTAMSSPTRGEG